MQAIFIKVNGKNQKVNFTDIIYVEGFKNYVRVHTVKGKLVARHTMREIESHLPKDLFCKIHKSYIISMEKLTSFDRESVFLDVLELPVSIQYYSFFKSRINIVLPDKNKRKNEGLNS